MDKSISRRLGALLKLASQQKKTEKITITLKSGKRVTVNNVMDGCVVLRDHWGDIANIEGGQYAELLKVVANPMPDRRIEDYE